MPGRRAPAIQRWTEKVDFDHPSGCWIWTAARMGGRGDQYGYFRPGGAGRKAYAHRWSYEHFVGPIPDGLILLHSCDNTLCVRPHHLRPGTKKENTQDMVRKGRNANQYGRCFRPDTDYAKVG